METIVSGNISGTLNLAAMISFYFYIPDLAWLPAGDNAVVLLLLPNMWNRNICATTKGLKSKTT
jgi:hypothetical protein